MTTETKTDMTVATTIASQMGGTGRLTAMTGAWGFVGDDNSLTFRFKSCRQANICKIELNSMDTYTVTFFKMNKKSLECPIVKEFAMVYCDQLMDIFESVTGLYLTLSPRG